MLRPGCCVLGCSEPSEEEEVLSFWGSRSEGLRGKEFLQVRGEKGEKVMAERMAALLSGSLDLSSQGDSWE